MAKIKIFCWNINSIRMRLEKLLEILREEKPDIVLLQELKCSEENFPFQPIEDLYYNIAVNCQKGGNGVAILSKYRLEDVSLNFPDQPKIEQARYIEALVTIESEVVKIASVYVPNGQNTEGENFLYKLDFLKSLKSYLEKSRFETDNFLIGGDYNVAMEEIDLHDPTSMEGKLCFHPAERREMREIINLGYYDLYRTRYAEKVEYSWWDYRAGAWQHNHGMRIDYFLASAKIADRLTKILIKSEMRGEEKPSDHAPIICVLAMEEAI